MHDSSSSETAARVLVIDDERNVCEMLDMGLTSYGFHVTTVNSAQNALALVGNDVFDVIICDVMLPMIDGFMLVPELRRSTETPIIMLSARGDVEDRVTGIRAGADDYMTKPFALDELVVRIQAALRRPRLSQVESVRYADLDMNISSHRVMRGKRDIELSAREFALLAVLLRSPRQIFSREQLLQLVWGDNHDVTLGSVETYISYLRAKIDRDEERRLIHTIRGVGYSLR
jgi:DNA-binding response OmpR family regulator